MKLFWKNYNKKYFLYHWTHSILWDYLDPVKILPDSERLKKHQEKAHNKKKDKCRACGAEFDYEEGLRKHKKNCK